VSILDFLTPDWLKNTFLGGIDLTLDNGEPYDERVYTDSLISAVAWAEQEIGISIDPFSHTDERHDGEQGGGASFWPFRLDHRPVIEVKGLRLQYGTFPQVTLPKSWANVMNHEHGQIHLIPNAQGLGSFKFTSGVPLIMGDVFRPEVWIPGYFAFDYSAGFQWDDGEVTVAAGEREGEVTFARRILLRYTDLSLAIKDGTPDRGVTGLKIIDRSATGFTFRLNSAPVGGALTLTWAVSSLPPDLKRAIGCMAARMPLMVAGGLIGGPGIANFSISVDGLSQSVGTTSSPENHGYSAADKALQAELKMLLPALKARYRIPNMAAF
jgi:hypothetical protein